jgi:dephospho-CoA kinase
MKKIIGLSGEIASGKGTVADYIKKSYNGKVYRFSGMLRDLAGRLYLEENRENLQKMSTAVREYFGQDILCKTIYEDVKRDDNQYIVIDGVRRFQDVQELSHLKEFSLVYIKTDMRNRYERLIKRGENTDDKNKTFEEFKKDNQREAEKQIKALEKKADFVINNNGSYQDLYFQIDKILSN